MAGYGERQFVQALVPLLISRLPNPFSPTEGDMQRVAEAAGKWADLLVDLRSDPRWIFFALDYQNEDAWNEPDTAID